MPTEYPRFFQTIVGLTPSTMKQLSPADMKAVLAAFQTLTGVNPLDPKTDVSEVWSEFRKRVCAE